MQADKKITFFFSPLSLRCHGEQTELPDMTCMCSIAMSLYGFVMRVQEATTKQSLHPSENRRADPDVPC